LKHRVAIWITLKEADIIGAQDSTIKNPVPNDFSDILKNSQIGTIFTEGKKATELFNKLAAPKIGRKSVYLPSTSPANRATQAKPVFMERWYFVKDALNN
uniref:DNA-deoxyinosine glycosylase n=1 Tax=Liquorilactobacillus sicerae TaxID=1416943 RepID=UPI0024807CB2